ncbi:hypothetical protein [Deinococcus sp. JMULE3]|uniref:hypothetical protein n=1 Tax=Deinococcus sp. JMULE3 TaxID=2518341 RepID=UPI001576499C|nr:hypothetical protein [Deinococcus sp. JMULE3]NTX99407.1 hypothetical protein [Deinococcus sp. JMULE3]
MKRTALLLAALNPGIVQAQQGASVTLHPAVEVSNVCAMGDENLNGMNVDGPAAYPAFAYNALDGDGGGAETPVLKIHCTAGTAITLGIAASGGGSDSLAPTALPNNVNSTFDGLIYLQGSGAVPLKAKWKVRINTNPSSSAVTPDRYAGWLKLTAPDGQWGVPAGTYTGTMAITVSYN